MGTLSNRERLTLAIAVVMTVLSGVLATIGAGPVLTFAVSGVALALLATIVGQATEQIGTRLGPGATGVLQSALGNLPELFVGIFALRAGEIVVVQAALVGSILGNSLLVLGLAFFFGGLRHGVQRFSGESARNITVLTATSVAALAIPTLAVGLHVPVSAHIETLSIVCAVVLLIVFAASIPFSLRGSPPAGAEGEHETSWPVWLAALVLTFAGVAAALVSNWFVGALQPAIDTLHISQAFAGLVIVAIAGNAVENVVGVQLMMRNKPDYAISVILNSSLQIALGLTPVLVLLSFVLGGPHLTLVLPGLLVGALVLAAFLGNLIVYDGESTWLEGLALIGLYIIIATAFWWGL